MVETGRVINTLDGNMLLVSMKRTEACAKCRACVAGLTEREMRVEAVNGCGAAAGDLVEIGLRQGSFVKAAFMMYSVPLTMLVLGFFTGERVCALLGFLRINELAGFITGIALLSATYSIIKKLPLGKKSESFTPIAVRIIT